MIFVVKQFEEDTPFRLKWYEENGIVYTTFDHDRGNIYGSQTYEEMDSNPKDLWVIEVQTRPSKSGDTPWVSALGSQDAERSDGFNKPLYDSFAKGDYRLRRPVYYEPYHVVKGFVKRTAEKVVYSQFSLLDSIPSHLLPRNRRLWTDIRNSDMMGCGCPPTHHGVKIDGLSAIVDHQIAPLILRLQNLSISVEDIIVSSCQGGGHDHIVSEREVGNSGFSEPGYLTMVVTHPLLFKDVMNSISKRARDGDFEFQWNGTNGTRQLFNKPTISAHLYIGDTEEDDLLWQINWSDSRMADIVFRAVEKTLRELRGLEVDDIPPLTPIPDDHKCDWCGRPMGVGDVFLNI